jgi:hypothetical protein
METKLTALKISVQMIKELKKLAIDKNTTLKSLIIEAITKTYGIK